MSNREIFREGVLLPELVTKLQKELRGHEGLIALDQKRYEEKIGAATTDEDGISALEDLLSTDPALAELFGSKVPGRVAAQNVNEKKRDQGDWRSSAVQGTDFPTKFETADGSKSVKIEIQEAAPSAFLSDGCQKQLLHPTSSSWALRFHRRPHPDISPVQCRLTFTFSADSLAVEGHKRPR